jgi:hypothetical protein
LCSQAQLAFALLKHPLSACRHRDGGDVMLLLDMQEDRCKAPGARLKSQLKDLEWVAWLGGNRCILYCALCEDTVAFREAIEGPVFDWPYCSLHEETPLSIRTGSPLS